MKSMLLAAGEGQRLRPITEKVPKPAVSFLNVPLAFYTLEFQRELEINNLVVNTYHLPEAVKSLFRPLSEKSYQVHFSDEKTKLLGSGGGLGHAFSYFEDETDFWLFNADEVTIPRETGVLRNMYAEHKRQGALATILVTDDPRVGSDFGAVWVDEKSQVYGFGKVNPTKDPSLKAKHYVGAICLSGEIFDWIPARIESNIFYDNLKNALARGEKVLAHHFDCYWFETGSTTEFLKSTESALQVLKSNKSSYLKQLLSTWAPNSYLQETPSGLGFVSKSAKIPESTQLSGFWVIGDNCKIAENTTIENCVLLPGSSVESGAHLKNQIIL